MAENKTESTKTTKKPAQKEFSHEDIMRALSSPEAKAIMREMVNQAVSEKEKAAVRYVPAQEEMVTLLYMGAVAEGSTVPLGEKLGEIQGRGGMRDIPKREFLQNITPAVLKRLKDRRLVVISGLTDDERERYGIQYKDGEILDKNVYQKLLNMDEDHVVSIFKKACYRHKQLIASIYMDAYADHDNRINGPLIKKLNAASKKVDPDGMFAAILKDMGNSFGEDEEDS